MTATPGQDDKPFGLNQIIIENLAGTSRVTLPAALELGFEEIVISAEFPGNDALLGVVTQPQGVKGAFKQGGIPLNALALMTGHSYEVTGSTPNQVATLEADSLTYPYFKIYGKSLGDESDDIHVLIYKAKLTSAPKGTFKRGEFFILEAEFTGVKTGGKAYDVVANETAADLPPATGSPDAFTLSSVPADGASSVAITANVVLTFSNEIVAGAEERCMIVSAAGAAIAATMSIDAARKVVTLNPDASLTNSTTYIVTVAGVKDIYGQTLADSAVNFETAAP